MNGGKRDDCVCLHDRASHYHQYVEGDRGETKKVYQTCLCRGCECTKFEPRKDWR